MWTSSDFLPPVSREPSNSLLNNISNDHHIANSLSDCGSGARLLPNNDMIVNGNQLDSDYQEIEENHESKYRPVAMQTPPPRCAPQIKIERKVFACANLPHSLSIGSSTTGSREPLDSESTNGRQTPPFHLMTSSCPPVTGGGSSADDLTPVTLSPKEPPSPLTPFLPTVPPNSPHALGPFPAAHGSRMVSALATMPRRKKDMQKFFPTMATTVTTDKSADYGPLTIDRKYKKSCESARLRPKPPTPPMRRLPSWVILPYCI